MKIVATVALYKNKIATMVICPYCQQPASLECFGAPNYPYAMNFGRLYLCVQCQAWVGCHSGTTHALGRLANAELRHAKQSAHAAFDPLWQRKIAKEGCPKWVARNAGYKWLSEQLGIPFEQTHIGMMDVVDCHRVVELCAPFAR